MDVIETVLCIDFVVDCKAAIFVTYPLFILGIDENLKHIDQKASVHDGRVIGEFLLVNR